MPLGVRAETLCQGNDARGVKCRRAVMCASGGPSRIDTGIRKISILDKKDKKTRPSFLSGAFAIVAMFLCAPASVRATPLSSIEFRALAGRCAPGVPVVTLEAVARTESGLDPLALHDNTTGKTDKPATFERAVTEAGQWLAHRDSVDIGLMQINEENLPALHMTVKSAFDPCASLTGGAAVLRAAYGGGNTPAEQEAAMLMALSRYNTGSPFAGIMNGYARTVMNNARTEVFPTPELNGKAPLAIDPNAPPAWNISASGAYAQSHGAAWLIDLVPSQSPHIAKQFTPANLSDLSTSTTTRSS